MKKHYYLLFIGIHGSWIKSYDSWRDVLRFRNIWQGMRYINSEYCEIITRKDVEKIIGKGNVPTLISEKKIKVTNPAYQFHI